MRFQVSLYKQMNSTHEKNVASRTKIFVVLVFICLAAYFPKFTSEIGTHFFGASNFFNEYSIEYEILIVFQKFISIFEPSIKFLVFCLMSKDFGKKVRNFPKNYSYLKFQSETKN